MFGFFRKKRLKANIKRALVTKDLLLFGIFKHEMHLNGRITSKNENKLIANAVNYIFGHKVDFSALQTIGYTKEDVQSLVISILSSDEALEKVVVRNLYDIYMLASEYGKDVLMNVMSKQPRIEEVLTTYYQKYPELFTDVDYALYRPLLAHFAETYYSGASGIDASYLTTA